MPLLLAQKRQEQLNNTPVITVICIRLTMNSDPSILTQLSSECQAHIIQKLNSIAKRNKVENAYQQAVKGVYPLIFNIHNILEFPTGTQENIKLLKKILLDYPPESPDEIILIQINLAVRCTPKNRKPDRKLINAPKSMNFWHDYDQDLELYPESHYLSGYYWHGVFCSVRAFIELTCHGFIYRGGNKFGGNSVDDFSATELIIFDWDGYTIEERELTEEEKYLEQEYIAMGDEDALIALLAASKKILYPVDPSRVIEAFNKANIPVLVHLHSPSSTVACQKMRSIIRSSEFLHEVEECKNIFHYIVNELERVDPGISEYLDRQAHDPGRLFFTRQPDDIFETPVIFEDLKAIFTPDVLAKEYKPPVNSELNATQQSGNFDPDGFTAQTERYFYREVFVKKFNGNFAKYIDLSWIDGVHFDVIIDPNRSGQTGQIDIRHPYSDRGISYSLWWTVYDDERFSCVDRKQSFKNVRGEYKAFCFSSWQWHLYWWKYRRYPQVKPETSREDLKSFLTDYCKAMGVDLPQQQIKRDWERETEPTRLWDDRLDLPVVESDRCEGGFTDDFVNEVLESANPKPIWLVQAFMGAGKTSVIGKAIADQTNELQIISHTQLLITQIAKKLECYNPYSEQQEETLEMKGRREARCNESFNKLWFLWGEDTALIIDEFEITLCQNVEGGTTYGRTLEVFMNLTERVRDRVLNDGEKLDITEAGITALMQDGITNVTARWLQLALGLEKFSDVSEYVRVIEAVRLPRQKIPMTIYHSPTIVKYVNEDCMSRNRELAQLDGKPRVTVFGFASASKATNYAHYIAKEGYRVLYVRGEKVPVPKHENLFGGGKDSKDVKTFIESLQPENQGTENSFESLLAASKYDCIVYTPAMGTGVSICSDSVTEVFGHYSKHSSYLARQMNLRVRNPVPRHVALSFPQCTVYSIQKRDFGYTEIDRIKERLRNRIIKGIANKDGEFYEYAQAAQQNAFRQGIRMKLDKFIQHLLEQINNPYSELGMFIEIYSLLKAKMNRSERYLRNNFITESKFRDGFEISIDDSKVDDDEVMLDEYRKALYLSSKRDKKNNFDQLFAIKPFGSKREAQEYCYSKICGDLDVDDTTPDLLPHDPKSYTLEELLKLEKTELVLEYPGFPLENKEMFKWLAWDNAKRGRQSFLFWLALYPEYAKAWDIINHNEQIVTKGTRLLGTAEILAASELYERAMLVRPIALKVRSMCYDLEFGNWEETRWSSVPDITGLQFKCPPNLGYALTAKQREFVKLIKQNQGTFENWGIKSDFSGKKPAQILTSVIRNWFGLTVKETQLAVGITEDGKQVNRRDYQLVLRDWQWLEKYLFPIFTLRLANQIREAEKEIIKNADSDRDWGEVINTARTIQKTLKVELERKDEQFEDDDLSWMNQDEVKQKKNAIVEQTQKELTELDLFFSKLKREEDFSSYVEYVHYLTDVKEQLR